MDSEGEGFVVSILSDLEDVIFLILKHLPMKDLHRSARVNVTWSRVVNQIKRNRQQIAWCHYNELEPGEVDGQIGLLIDSLASEPHFALIFASSALQESTVSIPSKSTRSTARSLPRAAKQEKITFSSYLERLLPPSCHMTGVGADGTVATSFSSNQIVELENSVSASCLFLPKLNDVDIYPFLLRSNFIGISDSEDADSLDEGGVSAAPKSAFDDNCTPGKESISAVTGIPSDKSPKLILLFMADLGHIFAHKIGSRFLENYNEVVIAGGCVDSVILDRRVELQNQNQDEPSGLGVAFCGGRDLRVASVVLQANINNEKLVEAELSRLRAAHLPERRSVGFMFACIGRGENFYGGRENVESKAFRKLFPTTPLLGFFGNGEIGFDHLPDYSDMSCTLPATDYSTIKLYHSYTTIFVIISFP